MTKAAVAIPLWNGAARSQPPPGGQGSRLRQPRLAQPVKMMLDILGPLEDDKTSMPFNCEPRVDPQHLRGLCPSLLELSRLRIGTGELKMRPLQIGQARCTFSEQTHRLPIALERVVGRTHQT